MEQKEIDEGSKLMAEYIGAKRNENQEYEMYQVLSCLFDGPKQKHFYLVEDMAFHNSWNWLMEVVAAVEKSKVVSDFVTAYDSTSGKHLCRILPAFKTHDFGTIQVEASNKKEAIFKALVLFIKWRNLID